MKRARGGVRHCHTDPGRGRTRETRPGAVVFGGPCRREGCTPSPADARGRSVTWRRARQQYEGGRRSGSDPRDPEANHGHQCETKAASTSAPLRRRSNRTSGESTTQWRTAGRRSILSERMAADRRRRRDRAGERQVHAWRAEFHENRAVGAEHAGLAGGGNRQGQRRLVATPRWTGLDSRRLERQELGGVHAIDGGVDGCGHAALDAGVQWTGLQRLLPQDRIGTPGTAAERRSARHGRLESQRRLRHCNWYLVRGTELAEDQTGPSWLVGGRTGCGGSNGRCARSTATILFAGTLLRLRRLVAAACRRLADRRDGRVVSDTTC